MRQTHTQTRMKTINWKLEHMHNFLDHTTFSLMGNYFVVNVIFRIMLHYTSFSLFKYVGMKIELKQKLNGHVSYSTV